jgi:adenylate cyclase
MTTADIPAPQEIRAQLERLLQNDRLRASEKQKNFLKFAVEETLEGRSSRIKGYTIAVMVYGRSENFDPQVDPIVRVEAGRLRRSLEHYYLTAGKNDPIIIIIPKGSYVPTFSINGPQVPGDRDTGLVQQANVSTEWPSVAVMPLINLTGDQDQDYFTDGLTEELTAEIARYQEFQVIASQSTMRFKGKMVDPRDIGRDLGVRFLLTGSVRRDSSTIKVSIRLLDTTSSEEIWSESYKRKQAPSELIAVQEEIARQITGAIADQYGLIKRILSKESRRKAPSDIKAYDAILRFYQYETELTPRSFEKALQALEYAIELDPEYGLAWAMLGHLHADNYALGFCEIDTPLEKALTYAQRGVALAPEIQFARDALTLVYFHRGDKDFFLKHAAETIALNPNAPYIVGVAGWHMMLYGEWEKGRALLKKGMKLNPYYPTWFHLAPYMDCYYHAEYENALAEALKFNFPELYLDPVMRAAALGQLGRQDEAAGAAKQLIEMVPNFTSKGRSMISRYVKAGGLVDKIIEGLKKAGLADLE